MPFPSSRRFEPTWCAAVGPTITTRATATGSTITSPRRCRKLSRVSPEPSELRDQRAGHAGRRDRGRRRHDRLRGDHRRRARGLHRREAPGPLPRRPRPHRDREDLGPDVLLHPVLRPQGPGRERPLGRGPGAVGPAGQAARRAGLSPARRRGSRRADTSTPPARVRTSPSRWASSAASCRCTTARPRARKACARTSKNWPTMRERTWRRLLADVRLLDGAGPRTTPPGWRTRRTSTGSSGSRRRSAPTTTGAIAALKKNAPKGMLVTTGEHEATRWGFRMLLEMECCDIIQPDVGWCGGMTELIKISESGRQPRRAAASRTVRRCTATTSWSRAITARSPSS